MEWLLPEGIEEIAADHAEHLESLRRSILDLFSGWGYRLVIPPLVEFCDSLFQGTGRDLDLQTFKLIDQVSGRLMGLRADITPQVARMDAKTSVTGVPNRLCYAGTVLHTRSDRLEGSRSPMQVGAELYGHAGIGSDIEILRLMLAMLEVSGIASAHLDIGHVGIYRELAKLAGVAGEEAELLIFDALQRKDIVELRELLDRRNVNPAYKDLFLALPDFNGPIETLVSMKEGFSSVSSEIEKHISDILCLAAGIRKISPILPINFDMAELRGYHYQTGLVFAAFVPGYGREIARGGRYHGISRDSNVEGTRPATGFSADLKVLGRLGRNLLNCPKSDAIFAPYAECPELDKAIDNLRKSGKKVVQELPGQALSPQQLGCSLVLSKSGETWETRSVSPRL